MGWVPARVPSELQRVQAWRARSWTMKTTPFGTGVRKLTGPADPKLPISMSTSGNVPSAVPSERQSQYDSKPFVVLPA
jgi:hypothetical protein